MIAWLIFALLAALLTGIVAIIDKKILLKEHAMEFSAVFSLTNAVLALFLIPFVNFNVNITTLGLMYVVSWLATLGFLFISKAVRHMEISTVSPLLNFGPALVTLLSFLFLGEAINKLQLSGIGLLLIGGYILETRHFTHFREFFYKIRRSKALHFVFLSLIVYSVSSIMDRYILNGLIDVTSYLFFVLIFIAFNFFLLATFFYGGVSDFRKVARKNWKLMILTGLLTFAYRFSQTYAVSLVSVALVVSIKRLSVLVEVVFGGELFHENHIKRKIIASLIMLLGIYFIVF